MYSIPDTTTFKIGKTNFTISCAGNDSLLNSKKIKDLLISPLTKIIGESLYKHDNYSFLFYSEYSLAPPYLIGLEHPNSTLICYHSAFMDNKILISSSIHEFIHAIYAPLRIRSEVINEFDFVNPICDKELWFYEGITEYLAIKTLVNSGFYSMNDFLNELNESNNYYKNINFSNVSANIYGKKEQQLFDNFYTKGSLFAFNLDIKLTRLSNGETNLFDIMRELQKKYNPDKYFNSENFIKDISSLAKVDIQEFISKNTSKKTKIDFHKLTEVIGYNMVLKDTFIWTYNPKRNYILLNYKKNRLEYVMFGSTISNKLNKRKITIFEANGAPLSWFNLDEVFSPNNDKETQFKATIGKEVVLFKAKPTLILRKKNNVKWIKNNTSDSELLNIF